MKVNPGTNFVKKIYTGLADAQVLAVNPTEEQIKVLLNWKDAKLSAPYCSVKDEGHKAVRIDIWYKLDNGTVDKFSIFLEDKKAFSRANKMQVIDKFGNNTWAESFDTLPINSTTGTSFVKQEGIRQAYIGEVDLIEFIKAWLCIGREDAVEFDNFKAMFDGNVSELADLIKSYGTTKKVQLLLGEKNGYQAVFTKKFGRAGSKVIKGFETALSGSTFSYQNSFELKEFDPIKNTPSPAPVEDDLPFPLANNPFGNQFA